MGECIGGYTLIELLGRGATGAVWRASNPHAPDERSEDVAIKRLSVPESTNDRERFRREADALSKLDHPNIIRVHTVIPDGVGIALVLDLAVETLADRLAARGPMSAGEVRQFGAKIADAIAHAHDRGLIHRDVKPANIFFNREGKPLLGDFGIAHDDTRTQITETNAAIGTAAYLDPETLNGAEPNEFSDQYGLGVTLYEALSGSVPFAGSVPMAVLKAAEQGTFTPLKDASIGPLATVAQRAFARDPLHRFPNLRALAQALDHPEDHPPSHRITPQASLFDDSVHNPNQTAAFPRRVGQEPLPAAPAPTSSRLRPFVLGTLALASLLTIGLIIMRRADSAPKPLALPSCSEQTQTQCVRGFKRTPNGLQVNFADGRVATYQVGELEDSLRVNNWLCGDRATLALYRPRTGFLYFFDSWPDSRIAKPTRSAAVFTGILAGGLSEAIDYDSNRCADLAVLENANTKKVRRTWFYPSVDTDALQPVVVGRNKPVPELALAMISEQGVIAPTSTTPKS